MTDPCAFAELSRDYCKLVDRAGELDRDSFLAAVEPRIARLYAAAAELPRCVPERDEDLESGSDVELVRKRLGRLFGGRDAFRVVFDPWSDEPAVFATLSDCLAGIYHDVGDGLAAFDAGESADAVWQWRFGWEHHWGRHAWEALAAMRSLDLG